MKIREHLYRVRNDPLKGAFEPSLSASNIFAAKYHSIISIAIERINMATARFNCPHCYTDQVAFDVKWCEQHDARSWTCIATCGACRLPISLIAVSAGTPEPPVRIVGAIEKYFYIREWWPKRVSASTPRHTPAAVERRFLEGEDAYSRKNWNSAVAMYRSALDIATKSIPDAPDNLNFYQRLIWLAENHKITDDIKDWGDVVRIEGNASLHDPEDFSEEDAQPLRLFAEMFLKYIFELPGEVKAYRGETPS